ncbi:MAG: hydroxyacid dehydrogenase [Acetobacterales bacterium]
MSYCLILQPIHPVGFEKLKEYGIEPRMASAPDMDTVAKEIGGAIACISRNAGLNRKAMEAAGKLLVHGNHGIGVDPVDVDYANEIGLPIIYTPYSNIQSVAEHTIALMFAVYRQCVNLDKAIRGGDWNARLTTLQHELFGKTLGIIGFGRIGRLTAEMCMKGFDMKVLVYSRSHGAEEIAKAGMTRADSLSELMSQSDIVSLHTVLTPQTRGLIDREAIEAMKEEAILVNTGRGATVDQKALGEALAEKRIFGAGLDVFDNEPVKADDPLCQLDNVVLTPHAAGSTRECLARTATELADMIRDVRDGKRPQHMINPDVWDRRRIPA